MKKIKSLNCGYSLPTIIFLFTFISFVLSSTIIWVSYNLHRAKYKIKNFSEWKGYYDVLNDVLEKNFGKEKKLNEEDDYTSPVEGWFSELPKEINGYKINYFPEDSKLDINHLDLKLFFKLGDQGNSDDNKVEDIFNKNIDKYLYYPDDLKNYLIKDASDDSYINRDNTDDSNKNANNDPSDDILKNNEDATDDIQNDFSIYCIPSINTADIKRLKMYMKSNNFKENDIGKMIEKINSTRNNMKINYIKFYGTINNQNNPDNNGLMINGDTNFLSYKPSSLSNSEFISLFDYKGMINLNFVSEKVFEIIVKACAPKNINYDYKTYWKKLFNDRSTMPVTNTNFKNYIPGFTALDEKTKIDNWLFFNKFFSVDSSLFMIYIKKEDKVLQALVRKFNGDDIKYKILKISARKINEIK